MTPLHHVPPWAIGIILSLVIAVFTECTSNVATATLFLPVFASLVKLGSDPSLLHSCKSPTQASKYSSF